jgi:ferric-dicitrate binding protein FerR (iron transport regulator)
MTEDRLVSLITRQVSGQLDPTEIRELQDWANEAAGNKDLLEWMMNEDELQIELEKYRAIDPSAGYRRWLTGSQVRQKVRYLRITGWAVAASVLTALVIGGIFRSTHSGPAAVPVVVQKEQPVLPGRNTATITLSSGRQILLDSAIAGSLVMDGNARVTKPDSTSLSYQAMSQEKESTVAYNVLATPRSGQYQLTLADGSHVWLNNVSSLRFPTTFSGKERIVELTGEGYFEIAKDATKPFIVKVGDRSIEVLGTSFNIMAYPEEGEMRATLLTGAVRVSAGNHAVQLKPDEQAFVKQDGGLNVVTGVNGQEIASWKNGFFYFGRASFDAVMRQIARWYNIDVVYEGKIPSMEFGGKIDRSLTLEELLKYLDKSQVHFRMDGRKLVVLP